MCWKTDFNKKEDVCNKWRAVSQAFKILLKKAERSGWYYKIVKQIRSIQLIGDEDFQVKSLMRQLIDDFISENLKVKNYIIWQVSSEIFSLMNWLTVIVSENQITTLFSVTIAKERSFTLIKQHKTQLISSNAVQSEYAETAISVCLCHFQSSRIQFNQLSNTESSSHCLYSSDHTLHTFLMIYNLWKKKDTFNRWNIKSDIFSSFTLTIFFFSASNLAIFSSVISNLLSSSSSEYHHCALQTLHLITKDSVNVTMKVIFVIISWNFWLHQTITVSHHNLCNQLLTIQCNTLESVQKELSTIINEQQCSFEIMSVMMLVKISEMVFTFFVKDRFDTLAKKFKEVVDHL